jgi:hypothetical protein
VRSRADLRGAGDVALVGERQRNSRGAGDVEDLELALLRHILGQEIRTDFDQL